MRDPGTVGVNTDEPSKLTGGPGGPSGPGDPGTWKSEGEG